MPSLPTVATFVAIAALLAACARSRHGSTPAALTTGTMGNPPLVYLDEVLRVTFAGPLDPESVDGRTVQLVAVEGPGLGNAPHGTWRLAADGTTTPPNVIEFVPDLPMEEPLSTSGGLQPDTGYELRIVGGDGGIGVRGADGRPLAESLVLRLRTRAGTTARDLFASGGPGGPRFLDFAATPRSSDGGFRLGRSNEGAVLRIDFDQPLDPGSTNLPRMPSATARGPIELVYDDPVYGPDAWVGCDVELERNAANGATVLLRPRGILPSAATLRLRIATTLRDLHGEDRQGQPVQIAEVRTETAYAPQFDTVVQDFQLATTLGAADFAELPAVVEHGALRVPETFPVVEGVGDWAPTDPETILRTDAQTLHYTTGAPRQFTGGVLHMRNLHIAAGKFVTGRGSNPLVLVVDGDARIEGTLSVSGASASRLPQSQYRGPGDVPPPFPGSGTPGEPWTQPSSMGPFAGPGGGRGGSTGPFNTALPGAAGESAIGAVNGGGRGGALASTTIVRASGGGGGGGAVQGDPWFPSPAGTGTAFVQRAGIGGAGGVGTSGASTRTLAGGLPGTPLFSNVDAADDHWGRAYVPREGRQIVGELSGPVAGSGGGSGGSFGHESTTTPPPPAPYDTGGDGGGGGGVVILQVRGTLTIGATGRIEANGGHGIGGAMQIPAPPDMVGGGGGGAGGMVVLMAGRGIVLHAHGETFANLDYDFAVSADGGVCRTEPFFLAPPLVPSKYPANGQPTVLGSAYDSVPLGGFGGLGVIQLMVPVGTDNQDGTNTVLDDAITIVQNGVPLQGSEKQRFLGWRGFPNELGVMVDDFGVPTDPGGQGDLRPAPIVMPVPFAAGRARARSTWLPLGAMHRRSVPAPDGLPRAVVGEALQFGNPGRNDGWLPHGNGRLAAPTSGVALLPAPVPIAAMAIDTTTFARPVYAVQLMAPLPRSERDVYGGCLAELRMAAGGSLAQLRVVGNTQDTLFLAGQTAFPANATRVQLHAWSAELATPEPASYLGYDLAPLPRANVRLGFAFHRAPQQAAATGIDPDRFPADVREFLHDLTDPATSLALRAFGPTHLQWDVLLDGQFRRTPADQPPPFDAGARIALRAFWLPVRY